MRPQRSLDAPAEEQVVHLSRDGRSLAHVLLHAGEVVNDDGEEDCRRGQR